MKTVLIAGGKGTRISSVSGDIPKPMLKIGNKPVLEHQIECLRKQGFTDIIITIGHHGNVISEYFGDGKKISPVTGIPFGVSIEYFAEDEPLGNAGALFKLQKKLTEDFLLINADLMFDVDLKRFVRYHKEKKAAATILTHPNNHPYDSSIIIADNNNMVTNWLLKEDEKPQYYKNRVNSGIHILSPEIFNMEISTVKVDLDRQILKYLADEKKLYCYDSSEYVKDMGTPDRFSSVSRDYADGLISKKSLVNKQKAIFIDRDGTINKYVGFLKDIEEFELTDNCAEAIRKINKSGYLAIVVTNQPVVARGEVTENELSQIHNKMETLLGNKCSYLDGIYYCPHHPHKGFENEIVELKIDCDCRKPKPGMIFAAVEDFNIDPKNSWVIGDSENDIKAGIAAGCKTVLIGDKAFGQDITAESLFSAVEKILI